MYTNITVGIVVVVDVKEARPPVPGTVILRVPDQTVPQRSVARPVQPGARHKDHHRIRRR